MYNFFLQLANLTNSIQSTFAMLAFSWNVYKSWNFSDAMFNQRQRNPDYGTLNAWYQPFYSMHAEVTALIHSVSSSYAAPSCYHRRRRCRRAHSKSYAPRVHAYPQAWTQWAVIELQRHSARGRRQLFNLRERFHTWTTRQNCKSDRSHPETSLGRGGGYRYTKI